MNNIIERSNSLLGEKYYYIKHKSGLDVYVFPKKMASTYALFGTKYGSVDCRFKKAGDKDFIEVPDGIAHFLEHKMFENENGEDTFARFAKTGAQANAYTSFGMTAYLFSATDKVYESLDILLDFVTHPYFTAETVEKEQGIIAQEIRMCEDNPGRALTFGMLQSMYKDHNVRIEIAGTVDSIAEITPELLYSCYNTFYNLNNMALVVCGDVDVASVLECADRNLKKSEPFDVISEAKPEQAQVVEKRRCYKMQVSMPMFSIGVKDIDISADPDERMKKSAAMSVISDMLFGKSSTFYNELYDEGVISGSLDPWASHNKSYSFLSISGEAKDPEEVYSRFALLVEQTKKTGLNKEDFERCKRVMYAGMVKSFDSTEEIANNFLDYVFDDGDILEFTDFMGNLEYDYTNELFKSMFRCEYYTMTTVVPVDKE
ncbi:MAG: insulinase family protein [Ruminococcaceae bacterium]|nr:insulinase family protein [Oscillospiraceae bacterium]